MKIEIKLKEPEKSIVENTVRGKLETFLMQQMDEAERFIKQRAEEYGCEDEDIFDLDFHPGFDEEDFANHNFDLGKWYACKETLEFMKKNKFCKEI